jgi:hypothetical protein
LLFATPPVFIPAEAPAAGWPEVPLPPCESKPAPPPPVSSREELSLEQAEARL